MEAKPFSQACENNKPFILAALKKAFAKTKNVLEVGSGTGQHAVFFAPNLPHLHWQCSDQKEYHAGINQWLDEYPCENLHRPLALKLAHDEWLKTSPSTGEQFDGVYTANTAHIMLENEIKALMQSVDCHLPKKGVFCQYGPFIVNGKFTSESNQAFHEQLIANGRGGYRDIDELAAWAPKLTLIERIDMPANNMMLVWQS
ncbi:MAG: cyclopropane fatty-acyl-phospholipid synthase-like methyltransferase [Glaciecola sp.]